MGTFSCLLGPAWGIGRDVLLQHPLNPGQEVLQPLLRLGQVRACRPEPMRQTLVHVDLGGSPCFSEEFLQYYRLIPPRVPSTDGEVCLLDEVGLGIVKERREALVLGWRAILL